VKESRRHFLAWLVRITGLATLGGLFYPFLLYLKPSSSSTSGQTVEIPLEDVPPGEAKIVSYKGNPTIVVHATEGMTALSAVCTHLGCLVRWEKARGELFCPCHAGRFDLNGKVLGGPPPKPLPKVPIKIIGSTILLG